MEAKKLDSTGNTVVVKKVISASKEKLFDAWTRPEVMNQWYCGAKGTSKATVDLRVGGKYTNEMFSDASSCTPGNEAKKIPEEGYMHTGEYLEISRPDRLVFTWNSPSVQNTVVTVDLKEVENGTEVTITHELPTQELCKGHTEGWTYALSTLSSLNLKKE